MSSKNIKILITLLVVLLVGLAVVFYQIFFKERIIVEGPNFDQLDSSKQFPVEDLTYTNPTADYTIVYPSSWNAQEAYSNITVLAKDTGDAVPPTIVLGVSSLEEAGATTPDEWFVANGLEDNDAIDVITKEEVDVNGRTMILVVQNDEANQTKVIHYVYFNNEGKVIILSHAPYVEGSSEAIDFEGIVNSLATK